MGFGWMFLGYLLLLGTNFDFLGIPVDITPDVIGFLLMVHGFTVACKYCDCFKTTRILGIIGIPASALIMLADTALALKLITLPVPVTTVVYYVYSFFLLTFTLSFLWSLYLIATQTGVERLRKKSLRCMVYTVIFFAVEHSLDTFLSIFHATLSVTQAGALKLFVGALYVIINATLVFGCYMWICLEGDEDMPDNRKHKYKTPFDYFDRAKAQDEQRAAAKKKKRKK